MDRSAENVGSSTEKQSEPSEARQPWCPVCRQAAPTAVRFDVAFGAAMGVQTVFGPHNGCQGAGRKVLDRDYGFVVDGRVVPDWEYAAAVRAHQSDRDGAA